MTKPAAPVVADERFRPHRSKLPESSNDEGWLVSYADMMTLMFGLFVLLFSISSVDQKKYDELKKSVSKSFKSKTAYQSPMEGMSQDLAKRLIQSGLNMNEVEIKLTAEGVQISLRGSAFFETGESRLSTRGARFVDDVGDSILRSQLKYVIRVEGHTDDVPIATSLYPTNWDLSSARAVGVVRRLEGGGIPGDRLVAMGFGASRPLVPNRTPDGSPLPANRARNRRIVIQVVVKDASTGR